MIYRFKTSELVCSQMIEIEINDADGKIARVEFLGGCPGNLLGVGKLVVGMTPAEAAEQLAGIRCGGKATSCPDQLATALKEIIASR